MFRFMCLTLSFTFLLFSAADGNAKFQIACLQIQDGHCNSSIYWQSVCSKMTNISDSSPNESNDVNTLDSKTKVPKHTNSRNKGTGHVIDSYSGNKGTSHVIDSVSRERGTYKSRIKFQVPQKIKSKLNPNQSKNANRGSFNAEKINNMINRGHQNWRRKGAPPSMAWSTLKGNMHGGFQTQNKKGSQLERPQRYTFNATLVTWERARRICAQGGGWLAKLDEHYKWEYLRHQQNFLRPVGFLGYIWMGLRYQPQRRQFFWVDGSVFTASIDRWSAGEPSHTFIGSPENCVAFTKGLRMNDRGCRKKSSFLCEYEPPKA